MKWFAIIFIAIVIETITENIKNAFPAYAERKWAVMLSTVCLGVLLAFTLGADIFTAVGLVAKIPYVGNALTGILVAGGSNIIFDLIKRIQDGGAAVGELVPEPLPDESELQNG